MSENKKRSLLKRADIIAAAVTLLVAIALFFFYQNGKSKVAIITVGGETVKTIDLSVAEDETFTLKTSPVTTIEIKNKKIAFVDSKCRDHTCEKKGFLSNPGDAAACLPAKAVITISGSDDSADAVSY